MLHSDIIIIGCGAAGLAAAARLSRAKKSVLILEARNRIGGRIWTIDDSAFAMPVELGAEFIHGRPLTTWQLVREGHLTTYDVPYDIFHQRGERLVHIPDYPAALNKIMGGLSRLRHDVSFADYLRRSRTRSKGSDARRLALSFVQGFDAADPERSSAKSLTDKHKCFGCIGQEMQFRLQGGYGALVEHLRQSLDSKRVKTRLNSVVTEIRWKKSMVDVRCHTGNRILSHRARSLIVTLPLGILQQMDTPGAVRFIPELPEKRRAASQIGSGPIVKAVMQFERPFWEDDSVIRAAGGSDKMRDASFFQVPQAPFHTWWTARPLRLPVLTAWAGGPKAVALSGHPKSFIIDAAIESLTILFRLSRPKVRALLKQIHISDWATDPYSHGAYSYDIVGGLRARASLAKPVERTLFFAGEATDTAGEASTVSGALSSGYRAAEEVLHALS